MFILFIPTICLIVYVFNICILIWSISVVCDTRWNAYIIIITIWKIKKQGFSKYISNNLLILFDGNRNITLRKTIMVITDGVILSENGNPRNLIPGLVRFKINYIINYIFVLYFRYCRVELRMYWIYINVWFLCVWRHFF